MGKLNRSQIKYLTFVDLAPHHCGRWMVNGSDAFGSPETWTHFELSGQDRRVRISMQDHAAIEGFVEPDDFSKTGRIFRLTRAGRTALAKDRTP